MEPSTLFARKISAGTAYFGEVQRLFTSSPYSPGWSESSQDPRPMPSQIETGKPLALGLEIQHRWRPRSWLVETLSPTDDPYKNLLPVLPILDHSMPTTRGEWTLTQHRLTKSANSHVADREDAGDEQAPHVANAAAVRRSATMHIHAQTASITERIVNTRLSHKVHVSPTSIDHLPEAFRLLVC